MMSTRQDTMYRNHFVKKGAKDEMVDGDERYQIQFTRLENYKGDKKYIRATLTAGKAQFMEILKTYGLQDIIVSRWEVWQNATKDEIAANPKAKGKNVPFQD